ncbi:lysine decarboxylase [Betaproteobacteria bacterium]|nr:lysine decarboxylase [Betaproteobacteria bacterium]
MSLPVGEKKKLSPTVTELLDKLKRHQASDARYRQPVGIIGPGDGGQRECAAAHEIAGHLAKAGLSIICGGRGGVMEAASRGATEAGGIAIGILPEENVQFANQYLTVAIPTGMGEMRNAVIARSSLCLIAIGGGMGTISEMALGLKWGKNVFALYEDVRLEGAKIAANADELLESVVRWLVDATTDNK